MLISISDVQYTLVDFDLRMVDFVEFELGDLHPCMPFAKRFPRFHEKALAFQVLLTQRAVEALRVVVVVEGLDPTVPGFYGEPAGHALGGKQLVPIFFAVG